MPTSKAVQAPFKTIVVDGRTLVVNNRCVWLTHVGQINISVMWNVGSSEAQFRDKIQKKIQEIRAAAGMIRCTGLFCSVELAHLLFPRLPAHTATLIMRRLS